MEAETTLVLCCGLHAADDRARASARATLGDRGRMTHDSGCFGRDGLGQPPGLDVPAAALSSTTQVPDVLSPYQDSALGPIRSSASARPAALCQSSSQRGGLVGYLVHRVLFLIASRQRRVKARLATQSVGK